MNGEIILDHAREPNVITRVLCRTEKGNKVGIREGGVMKGADGKRRCEDESTGQNDTIAGLGVWGRSPEPRNTSSF